jgi:hypothetical protein
MLHSNATFKRFPAAAVGVLAAAALVLSACGGGSSSTSTAASAGSGAGTGSQAGAGGPRGGGLFASLTASQRSCLAKQGVTPPTGPNGARPNGQGPPNGGAPGANGQPPAGGGVRNSPRFQKMQAAMKKCGVTLPARPPGAPGGQTGTTTGSTQN